MTMEMAILTLLLTVVGGSVLADLLAWCGPTQRWLLRRITSKLPLKHRARYLEEWSAELEAQPNGPFTRFGFVFSLLVRRRRLASTLSSEASEEASWFQERAASTLRARILRDMPDVKVILEQDRIFIAQREDGRPQAWRMEGRLRIPVSVPVDDLDLDQIDLKTFKIFCPGSLCSRCGVVHNPHAPP